MIGDGLLDPLGFIADELAARGALVERGDDGAMAVLSAELAGRLGLPDAIELADTASGLAIGCGLGSPLLDRLVTEVRGTVPVASVTWQAEAPRVAVAGRLADRLVVRNGVADVLGVAHASATYLAGVFAWTAEADDRYQGMAMVVAHAGTGGEPDTTCVAAITSLIAGDDARTVDERDACGAGGGVGTIAKRAALAIGPRLDEVGAAVARRRDRERARID